MLIKYFILEKESPYDRLPASYKDVVRKPRQQQMMILDYGFTLGLPIAIGIFLYGLTYFIVHDIFIHQRFKIFRNIDNKYARGVRRAHKIHHKNINKDGGECFGMLVVPFKYFK